MLVTLWVGPWATEEMKQLQSGTVNLMYIINVKILRNDLTTDGLNVGVTVGLTVGDTVGSSVGDCIG